MKQISLLKEDKLTWEGTERQIVGTDEKFFSTYVATKNGVVYRVNHLFNEEPEFMKDTISIGDKKLVALKVLPGAKIYHYQSSDMSMSKRIESNLVLPPKTLSEFEGLRHQIHVSGRINVDIKNK